MNENLEAGPECFRIIREFEKAPPKWPQTPDGAALLAYRCPSGQWTIGFGCCFWEDGTPVKEGDELFDVARIDAILDYNVRGAEAYVREHVRVPLNQYQFDALVSFRFNTRETTLRKSTRLLPAINAQEWDRAANAFSEFVYGSSVYNGKDYQQALRGLLRRRLCEALVFQGLDWTEAVKDNDVALPCDRILLASDIYRDKIRADGVTTLAHVRPVALNHPLPKPTTPAATPQATAKAGQPEPATQPAPAAPAQNPASVPSGPTMADAGPAVQAAPAPPVSTHSGNAPVPPVVFPKGEPKVVPPPPVVVAGQDGAKPKSPNTLPPAEVPYRIDPNAGLKPIDETDRGKGYVLQQVGIGVIRLGSLGVFGTTIQAGAQTVQGDPVLSNILLMGFVAGGIIVVGYVVRVYGDWKRKRGEANASQGMY